MTPEDEQALRLRLAVAEANADRLGRLVDVLIEQQGWNSANSLRSQRAVTHRAWAASLKEQGHSVRAIGRIIAQAENRPPYSKRTVNWWLSS